MVGTVLAGEIIEGTISPGDIIELNNISTIKIKSVEYIDHPNGVSEIGLVIESTGENISDKLNDIIGHIVTIA